MTPEGRVKRDVDKWLASKGFQKAGYPEPANCVGWFYKPVPQPFQVAGIGDYVGVLRHFGGRYFCIETKAPGLLHTQTENQKARQKEIETAGGVYLLVDCVATLDDWWKGLTK